MDAAEQPTGDFVTGPTAAATTEPSRRWRVPIMGIVIVGAVLLGLLMAAATVAADVMWFDQLGYLRVLGTQWAGRIILFAIGFLGFAAPVFASMVIAYRTRPVYAKLGSQLDRYREVVDPLRRGAMFVIPAVIGVGAGLAAAATWETAALWLNRTPFGVADPEFGLDVSYYMFELPFYSGLVSFAIAAVVLSGLGAAATIVLYGSIRLVGRQIRISRSARIQLSITLGVLLLLQAVALWLDRYELLTTASTGFLATGAGYTEVNAIMPGKTILAGATLIVAVLAFVTAVIGRWRLPVVGVAMLVVVGIVVGIAYPWIIQRFQVDPSAKTVEAEYIEREIQATREAYGVADVEEVPYSAVTDAESGALRADADTTASIRILDPTVVSPTFGQDQGFRQYYQFDSVLDVDRYEIDGTVSDAVLAVRELDLDGLSDRSWYNDTFVYTHGYGLVAAHGNQVTALTEQSEETGRGPLYFESGIPTSGSLGKFEPRIYFGENSPEYSIVGAPEGADPIELDYPAGENSTQTVQTTFDGDGGPKLDSLFSRLVYAIRFGSEQILFSDAITDESQILYDRDPLTRVRKLAPYLTLDNDPYPAVVDGRVVWIVDGYTTSTEYPYSEVTDLADAIADAETTVSALYTEPLNYIRNSVKATVDAYDGTVTLYAWDPDDPVLATWQKVYPGTVQPASEMSEELLDHVRYPSDLFKTQRSILGRYHVTDPGSFYSGDDQWQTPTDPVANNGTLQPPYYLTMQVPGTSGSAFTLYSTYIPKATGSTQRNVLTGYLAATGDAGDEYGKLTLLTLPTTQIAGPGQVANNFTNYGPYSDQIGIWGRANTVILGNLLTLPVGGGILYVQPVYTQASNSDGYPLFRKVIASFGDSIAFEDTLNEALDALFGGDSGAEAGDSGAAPTEPTEPAEPTEPTESGESSGTIDEAALQEALADYQQAFADRQAAYASGDLVAAAEADERMSEAVARALAASGL